MQEHSIQDDCGQISVGKQNIYLLTVTYIYGKKKKSYLGMERVVLRLLWEFAVICSKFTFGLCFHSSKEIQVNYYSWACVKTYLFILFVLARVSILLSHLPRHP